MKTHDEMVKIRRDILVWEKGKARDRALDGFDLGLLRRFGSIERDRIIKESEED